MIILLFAILPNDEEKMELLLARAMQLIDNNICEADMFFQGWAVGRVTIMTGAADG
eukprot:CAMPEP_0172325118 /NCGR_PEP_ID=MMETSP1058-20130122/53209_1 /TAXON_ID=83371 /ORGANISM="Detonula confervacea, Strain CCMP 353" /LENGTH=55 /DNA_ID=CAMNT_0013041583 /DNA_START=184 /DNA_END=347 /DNA_ORIENTATION=-